MLSLASATLVVLLPGCSSGVGGTASPTASHPNSSATSPVSTVAPKVSKPLDPSKFVAAPCSSLTAGQLAGIRLPGAHSTVEYGEGNPICSYGVDTTGDGLGVSWMIKLPNGLSGLYAQKDGQGYWIPTTIDGYPAVWTDIADLRAQGDCSISVAVNDHVFLISEWSSGHASVGQESCALAKQGAVDLIHNLGGA
jgi:hypothetical protein